MAEIFISYKSERRPAAKHLSAILEAHGYSVWYDYGLLPGKNFGQQIETEMRGSQVALVLWCSKSVGSNWVREEADFAKSLDIFIPVLIETCEIPLGFRMDEYIDVTSWDGDPSSRELDRLIDSVEEMVERKAVFNRPVMAALHSSWATLGHLPLAKFTLVEPIEIPENQRRIPSIGSSILQTSEFKKEKNYQQIPIEEGNGQDHRSRRSVNISLSGHPLVKSSIIDLCCKGLAEQGIEVGSPGIFVGKTIIDGAKEIAHLNPERSIEDLTAAFSIVRRSAYNQKYGHRGTDDDERFYDISRWQSEFIQVLKFMQAPNLEGCSVIHVGAGQGHEGFGIYDKIGELVAVDISEQALVGFSKKYPNCTTIIADAENILGVDDEKFEIYLSLRAFGSTFFDASRAVREAHRVLVPGGYCIISMPTKYLVNGKLVDGLARPGVNYDTPDRNFPFELMENIRRCLWREFFDDLRIVCGFAEGYIIGRKRKRF